MKGTLQRYSAILSYEWLLSGIINKDSIVLNDDQDCICWGGIVEEEHSLNWFSHQNMTPVTSREISRISREKFAPVLFKNFGNNSSTL